MPSRVLVIDDSALMRTVLTELINSAHDLVVVGSAGDPYEARDKIKQLNPDVITLDIEMPKMDGLAFLEKLMTLRPMPVLMVSSLTAHGAEAALRALELGAVDYIEKPKMSIARGMEERRLDLIDKLRAAARARVRPLTAGARLPAGARPPDAAPRLPADRPGLKGSEVVVAVGASTGGVECLRAFLSRLPADGPALVIAQHMPPKFTATFAARLDRLCPLTVVEGSDGARVLPGHAYIAPGTHHMLVARSGANYVIRLDDGPLVSGHRPSVDMLFDSVARTASANAIGVILTGMGRDGATGLKAMRDAGAATLGQDESSCVVYGMPKAAMDLGAVETELPLGRLPDEVMRLYRRMATARL